MSIYGETRRQAVAPVGELLAALVLAGAKGVARGAQALGAVGHMLEQRRIIAELATFDDRMLRDIGITRSDLRDASAVRIPQDPTRMLVLRATERRAAVRLAAHHAAEGRRADTRD